MKKLDELEQRFYESDKAMRRDTAELMNLIYNLSNAVAMLYYLLLMVELPRFTAKEVEDALKQALKLWKEVTRGAKEIFGIVDWSLLQDKGEIILKVAKRKNIPFNTVALMIFEILGRDAAKFVKEDSVMESYGLAATYEWKKLAQKY